MKYKLMAADMDGTLLTDSKEISPRTAADIRTAVRQGLLFTFCTGRSLQALEPYVRLLGLHAPLITYNGAVIVHPDTGEVLYRQEMEAEDIRTVLELGRRKQITMCIWSADKLYVNALNDRTYAYQKRNRTEPILSTDEELLVRQGVTKIIWMDEEQRIPQLQKEISTVGFRGVNICGTQPDYLEFFSNQVSKGAALERLAQLYGIAREEVIAVGDFFNDLPMIEYAGLGVAMENAKPLVKARADYITASNQEDGVGKVLEKFVL